MQAHVQRIQPLTERDSYRTPQLTSFGWLAALVEGGETPFPVESDIIVFSAG